MRQTAVSGRGVDEAPVSGGRERAVLRLLSSYRTEMAIAVAIVLIEIVVGVLVPAALTWGNITNIAQAAAPLVIMAFGVLLVVITGGIDLSVGSVFSLTGMVTGAGDGQRLRLGGEHGLRPRRRPASSARSTASSSPSSDWRRSW